MVHKQTQTCQPGVLTLNRGFVPQQTDPAGTQSQLLRASVAARLPTPAVNQGIFAQRIFSSLDNAGWTEWLKDIIVKYWLLQLQHHA